MNQSSQTNPFSPRVPVAARASVVNRTHRIVREQAIEMQATRRRSRSLLIPIAIFSALISTIFIAVWLTIGAYDVTPGIIPDASDQMMIWTMWLAPLTILMFGLFVFQRQRRKGNGSR